MSEPCDAGRRRFLAGLAGLALATLAGVGRPAAAGRAQRPAGGAARARALLPGVGGVAVVGAAYLAARPQEADLERLARLLELPEELPSPEQSAALQRALAERHRADFRADRVFELRGWILSLTELRLAAIVQLGAAQAGP
jgi:hypothetical protein